MAKRLPGSPPDWLAHKSFARSLSGESDGSSAAIKRHLQRVSAELQEQQSAPVRQGDDANGGPTAPSVWLPEDEDAKRRPGSALTERERARQATRADAEVERQELRRAAQASAAEATALRRKLDAVERQISKLRLIADAENEPRPHHSRAADLGTRASPAAKSKSIAVVLCVGVLAVVGAALLRGEEAPKEAARNDPSASQVFTAAIDEANAKAVVQTQEIAALRRQAADLEAVVATSQAETARLGEELAARDAAPGEAAAKMQAVAQSTEASAAEAATLRAGLAAAQQQISSLTKDLVAEKSRTARLGEQLALRDEASAEEADKRLALAETAQAAAAEAAGLESNLAVAQQQIADLRSAVAAAESGQARLDHQLTLRDEASAEAAEKRLALAEAAQDAATDAAALEADLAAAQRQIADLRSTVAAAEAERASSGRQSVLSDEANAKAAETHLASPETAQAATAEAGALETDLAAAQQQIADLRSAVAAAESGRARLDAELTARDAAGSHTATAASETRDAMPAAQTTVETSISDSDAPAARTQLANLSSQAATPAPGLPEETADADQVITSPHTFRDRTVVVTGSLVHLLWQYRLQSRKGRSSLVVNVERLPESDRARLEKARRASGPLDSMKVRIRGKVERDTFLTYRLTATELYLTE